MAAAFKAEHSDIGDSDWMSVACLPSGFGPLLALAASGKCRGALLWPEHALLAIRLAQL